MNRNGPLTRPGEEMLKSSLVLPHLLLCAAIGSAQESAPNPTINSTPAQKQIDVLLDRVSSLPPEYKADLGFTILNADSVSLSPAQRRSLLDDIFHSATRSHYPYGLTQASAQTQHPDIVAGLLGNSKLDALEIQTRTIERALPRTPRFAGQLFEEMKLMEDRASCSDANVEDVSPFYLTAAKIIEDRKITIVFGEDKESYLASLVANMKIPAEIAPLAELITSVPLPTDQVSQIEGAFDSALHRITASDREMTAAEDDGNLAHAIDLLSSKFAQAGISPGRLLAAYRGFLVRSLTPESCSDRSLDRAKIALSFNALVPGLLANSPDLAPLSAAQLEPQSKAASAPMQTNPYNSPMMTKLYRIAAAQAASSTEMYRNGQPSMIVPESSDVDDVIKYAVSLQPAANECSVCDFEAKGALLNVLVQLLPPRSELEKVLYAELDYLSFNDIQKDNPVAWLHLFKKLINASRKMNDQTKNTLTARATKGTLMPLDAPSADAPEIRDILRRSTDPIISTYILADDLLHLPYRVDEQQ
jgi:hypothetical protein